jgi:hypothetical protein
VFVVKTLKSNTGSLVCLLLFCIGVETDVGHYSPKLIALENRVLGRRFDSKRNAIRAGCR